MLTLSNVKKSFSMQSDRGKRVKVNAVDGVSFSFEPGACRGLVGESGSGKSTLSRMILGFERPDEGEITFLGRNIYSASKRHMKEIRKNIQMVFQDSMGSLNPKMRVYDSIAEPVRNFDRLSYREERKRVDYLLERVGLSPEDGRRYPYQFSGGQLKRICIARAIAVRPKFIVFDEAVSGLDATVKKKVLDLLLEILKETGSGYLFITHDMDVALYISCGISVMKDGKIIETVDGITSFDDFKHPYSKMLIQSLPPLYPN